MSKSMSHPPNYSGGQEQKIDSNPIRSGKEIIQEAKETAAAATAKAGIILILIYIAVLIIWALN